MWRTSACPSNDNAMITLTNLTAGPEIGANCYLLDMEGSRIVLDCGMHPKQDGNAAKPNFSLIGAADPDAIFITHSHVPAEIVEKVKEQVKALHPFAEVIETIAGCTISSHCGPCCLGVLFFKKKD